MHAEAVRVGGRSFDAPEADFTHGVSPDGGQWCTFEALIGEFNLGRYPTLARLVKIVQAADVTADLDTDPLACSPSAWADSTSKRTTVGCWNADGSSTTPSSLVRAASSGHRHERITDRATRSTVCRRPAHRGDGFWLPGKGEPHRTNDACPEPGSGSTRPGRRRLGRPPEPEAWVQGIALVAEGTTRSPEDSDCCLCGPPRPMPAGGRQRVAANGRGRAPQRRLDEQQS